MEKKFFTGGTAVGAVGTLEDVLEGEVGGHVG